MGGLLEGALRAKVVADVLAHEEVDKIPTQSDEPPGEEDLLVLQLVSKDGTSSIETQIIRASELALPVRVPSMRMAKYHMNMNT
jgi:hypothetical protein